MADIEQEVGNNTSVAVEVVVHRCSHIGKVVPKAGAEGRHWRFVEDNAHRYSSCSRLHIAYTVEGELPPELVE